MNSWIEVPLTQGKVSLVDLSDAEEVLKHKWHAQYKPHGKVFYANGYPFGGYRAVKLHNFIMKPPAGLFVDHINRDPLDNRRSNLRIATHSENCLNRVRPNKTGGRGMSKSWNRYIVSTIGIVPRRYLGTVGSVEEGLALQRKAGCPV